VDIESPYQIAFLIGFILITVFSIAFVVRFGLRQSGPTHSSLFLKVVIGLALVLAAVAASLLFYQALATGETYCLGLRMRCSGGLVDASRNPILYWVVVAGWYVLGWLFSSAGIFTLLRPNQRSWDL